MIDLSHISSQSVPELKLKTPYLEHVGVYAEQYALKSLTYDVTVDGIFGPQTVAVIRQFQKAMLLWVDGIVGAKTHRTLVQLKCQPFYDQYPDLPDEILESVSNGETSLRPGQVNWSSEGGVDVDTFQRHVYVVTSTSPWPDFNAVFNVEEVKRSLRIGYQAGLLAAELVRRHARYYQDPGAPTHEKAWRLAIYSHNRPSSADILAASTYTNLSSYWKTEQKWVVALGGDSGPLKFEDGTPVLTPYQQAQFYALGAPEHDHEGIASRLVNWSSI